MRAFLGLEMPDSSRQVLSSVRAALIAESENLPRLRWTPIDHLHLTVRFLGDVESRVADDLALRLTESLHSFGPLVVRVDGVSWFPARRPTVLAASVMPTPRVLELFERVESDVVAAGLPPESRSPNPHITIARIKQSRIQRIQIVEKPVVTSFTCDELVFFESRLHPSGASYSHYAEIPLGGVPVTARS